MELAGIHLGQLCSQRDHHLRLTAGTLAGWSGTLVGALCVDADHHVDCASAKVFPQYLIVAYPAVLSWSVWCIIRSSCGLADPLSLRVLSRRVLFSLCNCCSFANCIFTLIVVMHIGGHFELSYRQRLEVAREIIKRTKRCVVRSCGCVQRFPSSVRSSAQKPKWNGRTCELHLRPIVPSLSFGSMNLRSNSRMNPAGNMIAQYRGLANLNWSSDLPCAIRVSLCTKSNGDRHVVDTLPIIMLADRCGQVHKRLE